MSDRTDSLVNLIVPFGLGEDEARVYLALLERGTLSALQMARLIRMGRTKVYRLLDKLIAKELVVQEFDEAGFKFVAAEPAKLELMLSRREAEVEALRKSMPQIQAALSRRAGASAPGSQVLFYRGKRGLAQVNWNLLRAKGELLSYEVATLDAYMSHKEAEELRRELVANKILTRTIMNSREIGAFTKVSELVKNWWEVRWVNPQVLEVRADMFIYNDVYAVCHYLQDGDVFCVEMINEVVAKMQRQMFWNLWEQEGVEMEKVGEEGEARVGINNQ